VARVSKAEQEKTKALLLKLVKEAAEAGMPKDQVARFVQSDYAPLPWQMKYHNQARLADAEDGPFWIGLGGARGPGKSHSIMAQSMLDDCQRVPGLKVLFLRKVKKSAAESMEDLTRRVLHGVEHTRTADRISLPNGSRMLQGGYNNENDIDKYLGIEYDEIDIEEATQISEQKMTLIRGSCRSTIPGWRARVYMSTNPGGIGHGWWKKYMIGCRDFLGSKTVFVPSTYRDNPFLAQDYRDYLEAIPGQLGRAWRDGDFDVFAGQAFPQFDAGKHVVEPFMIPENWYRWRGIDEGYTAPWCCLWVTRDPDSRRIYVYREAYAKQLTIRQQAERIKEMTLENESIGITYADPAMWTQKNLEGIISSSADEYMRNGIPLMKADNKRIAGKRKIDGLLATSPDGMPGIMIFSNCVNLIEQLENIPVDPNNPEDVDTDAEDHCLIAGTMVATDNGDKPIEDIVPGDFVLTRGGYKPVLKSGMTIKDAQVYEVSFSNGSKIIATANHPVFVPGKGFVRVDALRYCDIIVSKETLLWLQIQSSSMVSSIDAIQNQVTYLTGNTIHQVAITGREALVGYIKKFGDIITEKYQKAITSIIKTATTSTMTYPILSAYWRMTTCLCTARRTLLAQNTWQKSDHLLLSGIGRTKEGSGTVNTERKHTGSANQSKSSVSIAGRYTQQRITLGIASARQIAGLPIGESQELITSKKYAWFAERRSPQASTVSTIPVQENAVQVLGVRRLEERHPVYNLHVADCNEFCANGILVHNSYDAARYAMSNINTGSYTKPGSEKKRHPALDVRLF
jgi:PBSX family phage terminase large subunit